ncbi:hypothetical protein MLGJGCBP_04857 [Rhodococcus sp. T7]|nr:hypothetical protein MLGJGCBP_09893 [Rhodococcus sp. T7]KAF0962075.1 hypothetical protein MLGJGCBP_04857 [Rhodococcus sp. T7]
MEPGFFIHAHAPSAQRGGKADPPQPAYFHTAEWFAHSQPDTLSAAAEMCTVRRC